jgi:chromosome segregation ATPase
LVRAVFDRLATGAFSPEVVFAERLQGYENVLLSLNVEEVNLTTEKTVLEREAAEQSKAVNQAKESIKTLEEQIEALKRQITEKQESLEAAETQESQIKSKIRSKEREIEKTKEQKQGLEREKKELLFGAN